MLSPTVIQWRSLVLVGQQGGPYGVLDVSGWDERPGSRLSSQPRPAQHGRFDTSVLSDERIVTVSGQIISPDRDILLAELDAAMAYGGPNDPAESLTVTRAGRTLTASARLTAFRTPQGSWGTGHAPFAIEWRCADPLRYGQVQNLATGFPALVGGLEFDLFTDGTDDVGWLEFGEAGSSGRVVVVNPGTADSWPQFQVAGPTPPFTIACVESGDRLVFSRALSAGEVLLINTATGLVVLNGGDVDYSGLLTRAEWFPVPREGSCTIVFLPDGPADTGQLTVIHRPAWW